MVLPRVLFVFYVLVAFQRLLLHCDGQFMAKRSEVRMTALPFPVCKADNLDCLRRSLRTFFFLMDSGQFGMKPVDPMFISSIALALPEQQMSFLLRRVTVTGARWTKLVERRFNLTEELSGTVFDSDLHVTGVLGLKIADELQPHSVLLTMDIQSVESNITYPWSIKRGIDNEDYILIGPARIAVRNMRTPTYFLQANSKEDLKPIEEALELRHSIIDHLSNEITTAVMHAVVDNMKLFSITVPIRHYYDYYYE